MTIIDRREFIKKGAKGFAGISIIPTGFTGCSVPDILSPIDKVKLGGTGLEISRLAFGSGTNGIRRSSSQTRLGAEKFIEMVRFAYEQGIHFFDAADLYGSHSLIKKALKGIPRENYSLLTKIWTVDNSWNKVVAVEKTIDRFRQETGSDYFDIFLLHCMTNGNWVSEKKQFVDGLSEAKEKGIIKKLGVSCHNLDALKLAAQDPWADVIMARINPFGSNMDGTPEEVMAVLETARKNGKGIIGMKIYGNGSNATKEERERSLRYALNSENIHSLTIGFESIWEIAVSINQIMNIVRTK